MNEAIERAAQAGFEAGNPSDTMGWVRLPPDKQEWYRLVATAALKTLHEPTRNMLLAADFVVRQNSQDLITKLNRTLIDKATDPKG